MNSFCKNLVNECFIAGTRELKLNIDDVSGNYSGDEAMVVMSEL